MAEEERLARARGLITEEAVKAALAADQGSDATLDSWTVRDFTNKGDNYGSFVTSVEVRFTRAGCTKGEVTYVVKTNPSHNIETFEAVTATIFSKEAEFFLNLLPRFQSALKSSGQRELQMPKCYHGSLEALKELIFLEDLRPRGCKMVDRREGLDAAHTKLVLKELARLHAASLLVEKKDPDYHKDTLLFRGLDNLTEGGFDLLDMLRQDCDTGVLMLEKIGGYNHVIEWVKKLKANIKNVFKDEAEAGKFLVVVHGDCWNNNLLFTYGDDGAPKEVFLVDLQLNRRRSLAADLNYHLFTSLTGDVRKPNLQAFLDAYYDEFCRVMEAGGTEAPFTRAELGQEFRKLNPLGVLFGMMIVVPIMMDPGDAIEFEKKEGVDEEELMENLIDDMRKKSLEMVKNNPMMKPRLLSIFDEMIEEGLIPKE